MAKLAAYAQYQATLQNQAKTKAGNDTETELKQILVNICGLLAAS